MRLMILTALYPPAIGGAATYFGSIAPELAKHDGINQLTVLTEHMQGQPREWTDGRLRLLRYLPTRVSLPGRQWLAHAVTYMLTQLWFVARLPGLIRRYRVELIHFHTRYRGRLFYAAIRRSGVPVLADLRDKMTDPMRLARVADRLICCGERVQHFATEGGFPADRTVLIPIPFTPPEIPAPELLTDVLERYGLSGRSYLLFVGDITYKKGVDDLLQAFGRWQPEHPQVMLVFAGTNREGERFLREVKRAFGAIYLGLVPHHDALTLIRGAEMLVLPSRFEGLPRVILEAVALGTKVVCPPGIPEFERYMLRFVLPSVDSDLIVRTINEVWRCNDNPSYPFSDHSLGSVVEALIALYGEVLR